MADSDFSSSLATPLGRNTTRRYVVLEHEVGPAEVHYDLCLEEDDVLVTFQLDQPPSETSEVRGRRSFDHRPLYLDYEGELSRGRGSVRAWDRGVAEDLAGSPRSASYSFRCQGGRLCGAWTLEAEPREEAPLRLAPSPSERS
ncbi:MAG: hypothetical protein JKY65_10365 [Planctomycetes bacterium]|nr:hypothetical protein [Planctomycetota bacterium]